MSIAIKQVELFIPFIEHIKTHLNFQLLHLYSCRSRKDSEEKEPPQPQPTKKVPRNGYSMFHAKIANELKGSLHNYNDVSRVVRRKWKHLSQEERDNYELDAEIFNIMDDRDSRNSSDNIEDDQHLSEHEQCDSYDEKDDRHLQQHYTTNHPPYQYQYDMTIPPPGPPPGPPPPGMHFDSSYPPPPPPGYDYSLPPPPPHDMYGNVPPPPPNYGYEKFPPSTSAPNFTHTENGNNSASQPELLNFKLHGSPLMNRRQSLQL